MPWRSTSTQQACRRMRTAHAHKIAAAGLSRLAPITRRRCLQPQLCWEGHLQTALTKSDTY